MDNILLFGILALILGGAAGYIWKAKKRGVKCIGCPDSGKCSDSCGSCSCGCNK